MEFIKKYLEYWPIIAASALFLVLGLWWRLSASAAMERAPKPIGWVKNYRSGAFPFRRELLGKGKPVWWALLLVLVLGAAFAAARLFNSALIYQIPKKEYCLSTYGVTRVLLHTLGAGAACCLLYALFNSTWVALPGALLFAASAARGHTECCFLALSLLFLLLYLRAEKPGLPAELLYCCAVLTIAPMIALRANLVWLIPFYPIVHWYKLIFQRRAQRLSGGGLILSLLLAFVSWLLTALLAALLYRFLMLGLHLNNLGSYFQPKRVLYSARLLFRSMKRDLFTVPTPGMTIDLMVDAPLFGLGFWGCGSAWTMARKRRDARGVFALTVLALLLIVWLVSGRYVLSLGLTLSAACILRDADLGKKRGLSVLLPVLGMLWYIGIQIAGWYIPLTKGLLERLV